MRKTKSTVSLFAVVLLMVSMIMPLNVNAAKKVKLNKSKITLVAGKTAQLKVLNNKKKVVWKSNKKVVAKVSKTGVVTAKKQGSAVITAKVGKKTYACKVVVKDKPQLNTKTATICVGGTADLKVSGTSKKVVWSSEDSSIATVTKKGVVTGVGIGDVVIVAKAGNKKVKCNITVQPAVSAETTDLSVANAGVRDITYLAEKVTCESSDPTIASVVVVDDNSFGNSLDSILSGVSLEVDDSVEKKAKVIVYGLKDGTVDITLKNNCNDEVVTFKAVVKKPEATTAKQKVINHVLLNGSLDNSVLAGYELENLGYKCLVKENADKTAVSGVIYNPLVDQIGYMDVKGSMVDASVFIAVPTENDETKLSLVIITLSTSGGELSDMNMLVTTLDQSTYTGNNLVFSNALIGSEVEESVHKQGNEITARAFENVSQMLNEAIGVKISDLGIKGIDDVLASNQ